MNRYATQAVGLIGSALWRLYRAFYSFIARFGSAPVTFDEVRVTMLEDAGSPSLVLKIRVSAEERTDRRSLVLWEPYEGLRITAFRINASGPWQEPSTPRIVEIRNPDCWDDDVLELRCVWDGEEPYLALARQAPRLDSNPGDRLLTPFTFEIEGSSDVAIVGVRDSSRRLIRPVLARGASRATPRIFVSQAVEKRIRQRQSFRYHLKRFDAFFGERLQIDSTSCLVTSIEVAPFRGEHDHPVVSLSEDTITSDLRIYELVMSLARSLAGSGLFVTGRGSWAVTSGIAVAIGLEYLASVGGDEADDILRVAEGPFRARVLLKHGSIWTLSSTRNAWDLGRRLYARPDSMDVIRRVLRDNWCREVPARSLLATLVQ